MPRSTFGGNSSRLVSYFQVRRDILQLGGPPNERLTHGEGRMNLVSQLSPSSLMLGYTGYPADWGRKGEC